MPFFGLFSFVVQVPVLVQTLGGGVMVATTTITVPGQVVVGAVAAAGVTAAVRAVGDRPISDLVNSGRSSSSVPAATVPAGCSTASQAASSIVTTCFERKTIGDWLLTNVVTNEESRRLLDLGFDRTTCFGLPELKEHLDFDRWARHELSPEYLEKVKNKQTWLELRERHLDNYYLFKSPGQPTSEVGYEPPKNWDGKLVKNPNGPGYGYPDRRGNVWVPTGENPSNPNAHGGPHWDVENPRTGEHVDVFPDGKIREH